MAALSSPYSRLALSGLVALLATVSCGGGDDEKDTPATRFMEQYADVYCDGAAPCCAAAGEKNDVGACKQFIGVLGRMAALEAKHFDQAAADQCLTELEASMASCESSAPTICDRVLYGDAAPGAACDSSADCALPADGWAVCDFTSTDGSEPSGKCVPVHPGGEGTPCAFSAEATERYECDEEDGLYCDYANDTCHVAKAIGAACTGMDCAAGSYCDSASQKCVALKPAGQPCGSYAECVETASCTGGACVAKKAVGEACETSTECQGFCDYDTKKCVDSGMSLCVTYE